MGTNWDNFKVGSDFIDNDIEAFKHQARRLDGEWIRHRQLQDEVDEKILAIYTNVENDIKDGMFTVENRSPSISFLDGDITNFLRTDGELDENGAVDSNGSIFIIRGEIYTAGDMTVDPSGVATIDLTGTGETDPTWEDWQSEQLAINCEDIVC